MGEGAEGGGEGSFVADDVARGDDDLAAGLQENGIVILELAGADLGALEILQDADGATLFGSDFAEALDDRQVIGMGAVGKIQSGHVHPGSHQLFNHGGG